MPVGQTGVLTERSCPTQTVHYATVGFFNRVHALGGGNGSL
jgi:hypothetical protein